MTDQTIALRSPPAVKQPSKEHITAKAQAAIHAMVWQGLNRREAAEQAGLSEHGLYKALRKPQVKALYAQECEVLRLSGRARRIHRLEEMVEQDDNKAAVINAALALERLGETEETSTRRGAAAMPGFTIQLIQHVTGAPAPVTIEHKADE